MVTSVVLVPQYPRRQRLHQGLRARFARRATARTRRAEYPARAWPGVISVRVERGEGTDGNGTLVCVLIADRDIGDGDRMGTD